AGGNFLCCCNNGIGNVGIKRPNIPSSRCCSLFDDRQSGNQLRELFQTSGGQLKVFCCTNRVDTVVCLGRQFHRANEVSFGALMWLSLVHAALIPSRCSIRTSVGLYRSGDTYEGPRGCPGKQFIVLLTEELAQRNSPLHPPAPL